MRRLFLHVGTGKTGTSALQFVFSAAGEDFAAHGIKYPLTKEAAIILAQRGFFGGNATRILRAFRAKNDRQAIKLARGLIAMCDRNVLLSSEGLFSLPREKLGLLKTAISDLGLTTSVIVFFRPQVAMFASAYVQSVKEKGIACDENFFALRRHATGRFDWLSCTEKLEDVFGAGMVKVCWYPAIARGRGVVKETFNWLGAQPPAIDKVVNPSPGREPVMLLQLAKRLENFPRFRATFLVELQKLGLLGSKITLNQEVTRKIEGETRDSNAELLRRYCPDLSVSDELAPAKIEVKTIDRDLLRQVSDIAVRVAVQVGSDRQAAEDAFRRLRLQ